MLKKKFADIGPIIEGSQFIAMPYKTLFRVLRYIGYASGMSPLSILWDIE